MNMLRKNKNGTYNSQTPKKYLCLEVWRVVIKKITVKNRFFNITPIMELAKLHKNRSKCVFGVPGDYNREKVFQVLYKVLLSLHSSGSEVSRTQGWPCNDLFDFMIA